jgi:copper resistance protein C
MHNVTGKPTPARTCRSRNVAHGLRAKQHKQVPSLPQAECAPDLQRCRSGALSFSGFDLGGRVRQDVGVFLAPRSRATHIPSAVWVAVLGLVLGVLASLFTTRDALAHASLTSISPARGATLASAPSQVVLTFDEPVSTSFATVTVTGPGGASVSSGRAVVNGATVKQPLATGLTSGSYRVAYRVVSDDGHPVSSVSTFSLALGAASAAPGSQPSAGSGSATPDAGGSSQAQGDAAGGNDRLARLGMAVGVGALALAAGTGLLAASRRKRES